MKIRETKIPLYLILDNGSPVELTAEPVTIPNAPWLACVRHTKPEGESEESKWKRFRITEFWSGAVVTSGKSYADAIEAAAAALQNHTQEAILAAIEKTAKASWDRYVEYLGEVLK